MIASRPVLEHDTARLDLAAPEVRDLFSRRFGRLLWSRDDRVLASASFHVVGGEHVGLRCRALRGRTPFEQVIGTTTTPQNFGGERRWFRCPACPRRARTLYLGLRRVAEPRWVCRSCSGARHATSARWYDRARLAARKLHKSRNVVSVARANSVCFARALVDIEDAEEELRACRSGWAEEADALAVRLGALRARRSAS